MFALRKLSSNFFNQKTFKFHNNMLFQTFSNGIPVTRLMIESSLRDSQLLKDIEAPVLSKLVGAFQKKIFFAKNSTELINDLRSILENSNSPKNLGAETVYQCLCTILDIMDKGNKGLLSGDLSTKFIYGYEKFVSNFINALPEQYSSNDWDQFIESFYTSICEIAFDGQFKLPQNGIMYPSHENPSNLYKRQLILENESNEIAIEKSINVYEDLQNFGLAFNFGFAKDYIVQWLPILTKAIKEEQEQCILGNLKNDRKYYAEFIVKLSPERIALISLTELMKLILKILQRNKDSEKFTSFSHNMILTKHLFDSIGRALSIQLVYEYEEGLIKAKEDMMKKMDSNSNSNNNEKKYFKAKQSKELAGKVLNKKNNSQIYASIGIPKESLIKLGSFITYLIKEIIKIKNDHGFYEHLITLSYQSLKKKKHFIGIIMVNENFLLNLMNQIEKNDSPFIQLDRCLPTIYKPAPWKDYEIGGYYLKPTNLMRIQESQLQERVIKYGDLTNVFQILDILSQTPWRINKRVLKAVETIWELGGDGGQIPKRYYNYNDYVYEYQYKECKDPKEKKKMLKKIQLQRDIHSLKCDFSLKLNVAKAFQNISKIYFPHNVDFRGRVYPIPPHLNHMGADICRGLLEFAEGKPIGPNGVKWLKIHLANKMGQDKLSFPDRLLYVDSMSNFIQNCVKDPIKNREWLDFEDCWQTLAAMYEYVNVLSHPKPEEYISHLHIHQDGSFNGLQHYAALGRDYEGAKVVNLINSDKPGDIYTQISKMVQEMIDKDANDPNHPKNALAKKLKGEIKRKVIKQTVMTTVYGVTFLGARKQIQKQLKDKPFLDHHDDSEEYQASNYIAKYTLECVKNLFSGAHDIKKWLIECAGLVANTSNPMSWITPFGLPVIQPYRNTSNLDVISTIIQSVTVTSNQDDLPVNKTKQKSAFPPNFIHSLDSTHLMYTAIECKKENITFAAVHDSYWTHLCTVDRMNEILRNQFVHLHSQPLLEELKTSLERRYPFIKFPDIPQGGQFNLQEIKNSKYFFA